MKLKTPIFSCLALALLFTSCASYRASPLCDPSPCLVEAAPRNENVSVASKTFNRSDCLRFLDRDVLAEGYQPLQLYIQNDSKKSYIFSLNRISLPTATPEEVAEKVHTSTVGRVLGYSAGALFFWPLVIPAIVDGIESSKANRALDNDFFAKAARDRIIRPHSRFNALIFVPVQAYQSPYTITLIDQDSKEPKVFDISSSE